MILVNRVRVLSACLFVVCSHHIAFAQSVLLSPSGNQNVTQPAGTSLGVNSLNGIPNVNEYPGSTVAAQTTAAQTACTSPGCILVLPPNMGPGALADGLSENTLIQDERWTNSAGVFNGAFQGSHAFYEFNQNIGELQSWETGSSAGPYTGPSMLSMYAGVTSGTETPTSPEQGEVIPLYINIEKTASQSHRFIEGEDINLGFNNLLGPAVGLEIDMNNSSGVSDTSLKSEGLQIIGGGNSNVGAGFIVSANQCSSGISCYYEIGGSINNYVNFGLGLNSNTTTSSHDIYIVTPDTTSTTRQAIAFAGGQFYVTNNGNLTTAGTITANNIVTSSGATAGSMTTSGGITSNGELVTYGNFSANGEIINGTAFQSVSGSLGCSTAAAAGATCTSGNLPWAVGFANTNYSLTCTLDTPSGVPVVSSVRKGTVSFTITIAAMTSAAATGNYNCTGIMHS